MSDTDPAYIGIKPCGCVVAAAVDLPAYKASVARDVADWVRKGLVVERTTVAEARSHPRFLRCECEKATGEIDGQEALPV